MKKILLFMTVLMVAVCANAQEKYDYGLDEVVQTSDYNKSILWSNLKRWISKSFTSYKYTVDMEDRESGTIIIKFNKKANTVGDYVDVYLYATLEVNVKDNKYRYKISDGEFSVSPSSRIRYISSLPTEYLNKAKVELTAAENIGTNTDIPSGLEENISYYSDLVEKTPIYKKPKDMKKGKINPLYQEYEKSRELALSIRNAFSFMTIVEIGGELQRGMNYKNDF